MTEFERDKIIEYIQRGGKILLLIIEKIRRKPFSEKTEMTLTLVGFSLIILLALVVTVSDVVGLF